MFKCIPFVFCLVVAWDVITDFASEILEKVSRCAAVIKLELSNMCPLSTSTGPPRRADGDPGPQEEGDACPETLLLRAYGQRSEDL